MDTEHAIEVSGKVFKQSWTFIENIDPSEALLLVALYIAGFAIGTLLNRVIDRMHKRDWTLKLVDFLAPLLHSLSTIALISIMLAVFKDKLFTPHLLPLGLKCAIAWFAIRLVMLMSSQRTAGWFIVLVIAPITLLNMFGIWEPLTETLKGWEFTVGSVKLTAYSVLRSALAVFILFWVASFISNATDNRLKRIRSMRASNRVLIMKIFQIVLYFVVFLIGLQIMGVSLTALSVFGGALGVGIGFGLQKVASNFISGIILLFERSIQVDDLIELADGTTGFVRHTGARYTLIETADGKDVLIPNEDFITQRTTNWTYSNRKARVTIEVGVGYESDLHLARKIMTEAASTHPRCLKDPAPACFVDRFGDSAIVLILYFWVADVTDGRLEPKSDTILAIWDAFRKHGISIPYPQREVRVYKQDAKDDEDATVTP